MDAPVAILAKPDNHRGILTMAEAVEAMLEAFRNWARTRWWRSCGGAAHAGERKVSTVGLFYSQAEARKIVDMLRVNPDRVGYRHEIGEAVRHILTDEQLRQDAPSQEE